MPISIARWCHYFHEIAVENCEISKNRQKVLRTTSYRYQKDLNKISPQHFRAQNIDVHLYNFFRTPLRSAGSIVKIRMGSPKMAYRKYIFHNVSLREDSAIC